MSFLHSNAEDCSEATHKVMTVPSFLYFPPVSRVPILILFCSFAGPSTIVGSDIMAANSQRDRCSAMSLSACHRCLVCGDMYRWAFEDCFFECMSPLLHACLISQQYTVYLPNADYSPLPGL